MTINAAEIRSWTTRNLIARATYDAEMHCRDCGAWLVVTASVNRVTSRTCGQHGRPSDVAQRAQRAEMQRLYRLRKKEAS